MIHQADSLGYIGSLVTDSRHSEDSYQTWWMIHQTDSEQSEVSYQTWWIIHQADSSLSLVLIQFLGFLMRWHNPYKPGITAKSEDPDQRQHDATSDQGFHYLLTRYYIESWMKIKSITQHLQNSKWNPPINMDGRVYSVYQGLLTLTLSSKATTKGSSVSITRFFTSLLDRGGPPSSSVWIFYQIRCKTVHSLWALF